MAVYDSEGELLFDESTMTIFSKIPLSALNMGSMRSLSRFLNIRSQTLVKTGIARGIPPDWTGLAELSSHFDIRDIMNFKEGQHDPTEALVNEWMTKDDATIEKLVTCIKDLERFDLLEELKLHLGMNHWITLKLYYPDLHFEKYILSCRMNFKIFDKMTL